MNIKIQRYDFGSLRDFRGPLVVDAQREDPIELAPPPPPPPVYDEADLELARADAKKLGYQEGFLAGKSEAAAAADAQAHESQQIIISLANQLADLEQRYAETLTAQSKEVAQLAYVIAKKVASDALNHNSAEVVAELVRSCLPVILSKPRILIELHTDALADNEVPLRQYLANERYEGEILFRANPGIARHDARIDWVQGHAERNTAALWQEIESLLQKIPTTISLAESHSATQSTTTQTNNDAVITGE